MTSNKTDTRTGVWLIGALGSIAVTVMVGAMAVARDLAGSRGMVTAGEPFARLGLVPVADLVFGGWDIRREKVSEAAARTIKESGCLETSLITDMADEIAAIDARIRPGLTHNCGPAIVSLAETGPGKTATLAEEIERLRSHLRDFKKEHDLSRAIVINLASTEPPLAPRETHMKLDSFEKQIGDNNRRTLRASSLYSYAALQEGCPVINFTPSGGTLLPALVELARRRGLPVMGSDGKTGETLVKSALAPMFASRNLEVLSWEGFNILGNLDGKVLNNPENRETKIKSKDRVLGAVLGYQPHSRVHINFVPSLGDQKTAWDFIHFQGFLGAKMSLQFTWQAHDSLLAAPLVLDLVRLTRLALDRGESGPMVHLASFFKTPLDVEIYDHHRQVEMLRAYVERVLAGQSPTGLN